jgi:hypothetical protein
VVVQPRTQRRVLAVDLIGGHPAERHPRRQGALDHLPGQLGLGSELAVTGNSSLAAAIPVGRPRLRQIQLPVDQRPATAGNRIGQEHPELAGRAVRALPPSAIPTKTKSVSRLVGQVDLSTALLDPVASQLMLGRRALFGSPLKSSVEFLEAVLRVLEQARTEAD